MRGLIDRKIRAVGHWFREARGSWDRFWFTAVDPTPLALIRLSVGGILVYAHIVWGLRFDEFLGSNGWIDIDTLRLMTRNDYSITFWKVIPEAVQQPAHVASVAVLLCFWLGLFTRCTAWLTVLIVMSYTNRNPVAAFGLDQIFSILVLYLAIGPSGARWSLDEWIFSRRQKQSTPGSVQAVDGELTHPAASVSANLAIRLIQLHLCLIYFYSGAAKLQGVTWWTGEALWRVIANLEYQTVDLTWLAAYPKLIEITAHVTVLWELSFVALIWIRPLRPLVLAVGILMHLGIGAFLGMWTFGLAMIAGYWAFGDWSGSRQAPAGTAELPASDRAPEKSA